MTTCISLPSLVPSLYLLCLVEKMLTYIIEGISMHILQPNGEIGM